MNLMVTTLATTLMTATTTTMLAMSTKLVSKATRERVIQMTQRSATLGMLRQVKKVQNRL